MGFPVNVDFIAESFTSGCFHFLLAGLLSVCFWQISHWLYKCFFNSSTGFSSSYTKSDSDVPLRPIENAISTVFGSRHLVGFHQDSARYVNKLIKSAWSPVFKVKLLTREFTIIKPDMERELARHSADLGLAPVVALTIGKSIFPLTSEGRRLFSEVDTQAAFHAEFVDKNKLYLLLAQSAEYVASHMETLPERMEVEIGEWVFDLTAATTAYAISGPENPWILDKEFTNQFRILAKNYDTLYYPAAWLTARHAYKARQVLLSRLRSFHKEHRESRIQSVAHRLNVVAMTDAAWEENPDYYVVELLMYLAIVPTMSTIAVWFVRHLLAQPQLLSLVVDEIEQLRREQVSNPSTDEPGPGQAANCVDLDSLKTTCPWLVASWHETLRLHMSGIPRSVRRDFDLAVPSTGSTVSFSAGDIILIPMCANNLDPEIWGPDYQLFNPGRFITTEGKLSVQMTRRVRGFGMAGNLCPGRFYAFTTTMAVVIAVLLTVDIDSKGGKGFREPTVLSGFSGGFERYADEEQAVLTRKPRSKNGRLIIKV